MNILKNRPIVLLILDGWGIAPEAPGNAVWRAKTANFDKYVSIYPTVTLLADGEHVGLCADEPSNSEIGHLNIGCGRIIDQDNSKINQAIKDKSFFKNEALIDSIKHSKKYQSKLHLIGLLSNGNVHSHIDHLYALLDLAEKKDLSKVYLHLILDGIDTRHDGGLNMIEELQEKISQLKIKVEIATIMGRSYAMDRDGYWSKTEKVFLAMTRGECEHKFTDPIEAIKNSYEIEVYDPEFIPTVIFKGNKPIGLIENGDSVIFFNFRGDRMRQLSESLVLPHFNKFERFGWFNNSFFTALTSYDKYLPFDRIAFNIEEIKNPLAKIISDNGFKQLHLAESEKFSHISTIFNGLETELYENEEHKMIPSVNIDSYDKKPQMSARKITEEVIKAVNTNIYDFIAVNFANPDIVGHTGNLKATIKACEVCDKSMRKIVRSVLAKDGIVIITSDHGKAEELQDIKTGEVNKIHSLNPVPLIIIGNSWEGKNISKQDVINSDLSLIKPSGRLSDIAPTILKLMDLDQPNDMTGESLI